jgi:sodium transport system permease protein
MGRLIRLVRKELSEVLRDRRTIITLVLMPLLLYPLLSIGFQQYLLAHTLENGPEGAYRVGFASKWEQVMLVRQLLAGLKALEREAGQGGKGPGLNVGEPQPDLDNAVLGGTIDLGVRLQPSSKDGRRRDCELLYRKDSARGRRAAQYVEQLLAAAQRRKLEVLLHRAGSGAVVLRPEIVALEPPGQAGRFPLAPIIPLVLILMTITGAVYPAIDLTAGERERGTLEILVAAPVPRMGLLFAKYVSVLTIAVLTALVNLVTMFVTIALTGLGNYLFPDGPSLWLPVQLFGLLLLFAAFFSAVLLTLTSFARSFKEAQAYLVPLMLASLGPGLLGILPGMELTGFWTVMPLVNIVLLARDLLEPHAIDLLPAATLVVSSTLLYALAAVALAARIFGSEGVLYNEQNSWSDLWRRPAQPQQTPTIAGALLCLALMFPTYFLIERLVTLAVGVDVLQSRPMLSVGLMMLLSVLLFGGFPVVAALCRRVQFRSGFLLRPARLPAYAGGLLLGLALWPFVLEGLTLLQHYGLTSLDLAANERVAGLLLSVHQKLPAGALIAAFVVVAGFEELFFRGYLFSALRAGSGPAMAVIVSAVLFGFFHVLVTGAFGLERLLPSTLLGLVLGWVCLRSGSVLPAMLLHACYDALLDGLGSYPQVLLWVNEHVGFVLAGAAVLAAIGVGLVFSSTRGTRKHE